MFLHDEFLSNMSFDELDHVQKGILTYAKTRYLIHIHKSNICLNHRLPRSLSRSLFWSNLLSRLDDKGVILPSANFFEMIKNNA